MKIWKLTLWKVSGVNDTIGHFPLQSLATKDLWESESLRLVSRDPNLVHATNNINFLIFVLHIRLSAGVCLAHTAYFSWPSGPPTGLSSPLSPATLSSGTKKGENSSLNSWLIVRLGRTNFRKEDDTFFRHTLQYGSKNVANRLLHGGFII